MSRSLRAVLLRLPSQGGQTDIQGLRALAVLLVIFNHLLGWPTGGFIGVDVFFVISGYLITGLLVRASESGSGISIADFYRRRARRLLPASLLVVSMVSAFSMLLSTRSRAFGVLEDAVWSVLFAQNWHLARLGTDYWEDSGTVSPLQHFWSLGVEEQFYFVWPWVIIAIIGYRRYGKRRGGEFRAVVLVAVLATAVAASLVYSVWHSSHAPTAAYFSTLDRAWELGAGAMVAMFRSTFARFPVIARVLMGLSGLVGVVASSLYLDSSVAFPGPWAIPAVASTAMILAASVGGNQYWLLPISNPVARYVGDLSYSLYLWHFPVIILLRENFWAEGTAWSSSVSLALIVALSIATYHLVEHPIHHSSWLEPKRRLGNRGPSVPARTSIALMCSAGLVVGMASVAAVGVAKTYPEGSISAIPALRDESSRAGGGEESLETQQQALIEEALQAEDFPILSPPIDGLSIQSWVEDLGRLACYQVEPTPLGAERCTFGARGGSKQVAIVGDSFGAAWMPGVLEALNLKQWSVRQYTYGQCPAWGVPMLLAGEEFSLCSEFHDWAIGQIEEQEPDVVVLASAAHGAFEINSDSDESPEELVAKAMASTVGEISRFAKHVVVLGSPPQTGNLQTCAGRVATPDDCAMPITGNTERVRDAERIAVEENGGTYVDTRYWFCSRRSQMCPAFIGGVAGRVDGVHISVPMAVEVSPLIKAALIPFLR